jgi:hypothetical protein
MRPVLYKPEYDELILQILTKGETIVSFCAEVMVSKQTFYDWVDREPSFKEAYEVGMMKAEAFWIRKGVENEDNPDFNHALYTFQLGSRFGITKTRKSKSKKVAPVGKIIKNPKNLLDRFNNAILDFPDGEISHEELDRLAAAFMKMADIKEREDISARVAEIEASMKLNN